MMSAFIFNNNVSNKHNALAIRPTEYNDSHLRRPHATQSLLLSVFKKGFNDVSE